MTPEQRKAQIAQAEALLNAVAADETAAASTPAAPSTSPAAPATAPVTGFFSRRPPAANAQPAAVTASPAPAQVTATITGPGGDTRTTGAPSVAATMKSVWAIMKGKQK